MLRFALPYRRPYDAAGMRAFFAQRAVRGVERLDAGGDGVYRRTLAIGAAAGWVACRFDAPCAVLAVEMSTSLEPVREAVAQRLRDAFDLDADPADFEPQLAALGAASGMRLPGGFDGFESALRVVLGQQVSVAAASTLAARLVERFGRPIETPHAGLERLFPDAATLAAATPEAIGRLGIFRRRAAALHALATAVASGALRLERTAPLEATLAALHALPGLGDWSVQLIAMRALKARDAFPASDVGVLAALGLRDPRAAARWAEPLRPWRAYAVPRLWQRLASAGPVERPAP